MIPRLHIHCEQEISWPEHCCSFGRMLHLEGWDLQAIIDVTPIPAQPGLPGVLYRDREGQDCGHLRLDMLQVRDMEAYMGGCRGG